MRRAGAGILLAALLATMTLAGCAREENVDPVPGGVPGVNPPAAPVLPPPPGGAGTPCLFDTSTFDSGCTFGP
jgi:hypothetical protein